MISKHVPCTEKKLQLMLHRVATEGFKCLIFSALRVACWVKRKSKKNNGLNYGFIVQTMTTFACFHWLLNSVLDAEITANTSVNAAMDNSQEKVAAWSMLEEIVFDGGLTGWVTACN